MSKVEDTSGKEAEKRKQERLREQQR